MLATDAPFPLYHDLDGSPLDAGYVYFGTAGGNPETSPATVYWDAAGTQPAAQPIRTVNGYTVRNGTQALVYASGDYSLTVRNRSGSLVSYTPNAINAQNDASILSQLTTFIANLAASAGSALIGFIQAGTGAIARTVQSKLRDQIDVRDFGVDVTGATDSTVALQAAVDALTPGQTLVARGSIKTAGEVWLRKSDVVYDFEGVKWNFTAQTGYGGGLVVGNIANKAFIPTNVTILCGDMTPVGSAVAYPLADYNPIAVIAGKTIRVKGRVFPKSGTRAVSIQTDNTWGGGTVPVIDNVVCDIDVIGDGNAVDGVDITSAGGDGLIGNVWVNGTVRGCKRGVNVSTGSDSYNFTNINLDVDVIGATEVGANVTRLKKSEVNVRAIDCTKAGVVLRQLADCNGDFIVTGTGGSLGTGLEIADGIGTAQNFIEAQIKGPWTQGITPQSHECTFGAVEIDGAVTPITTSGFRTSWGRVVLKDCTNDISNMNLGTDTWGEVVKQVTGSSPRVIRRSVPAADGSTQRYALDLHGEATITIAAGATAQPFGASTAFGGPVIIHGTSGTGDAAIFLLGNGVSKLVSDTGSTYSQTSGTASRVNVYYATSVLTIQNNLAVSVTLRVAGIRMRNAP